MRVSPNPLSLREGLARETSGGLHFSAVFRVFRVLHFSALVHYIIQAKLYASGLTVNLDFVYTNSVQKCMCTHIIHFRASLNATGVYWQHTNLVHICKISLFCANCTCKLLFSIIWWALYPMAHCFHIIKQRSFSIRSSTRNSLRVLIYTGCCPPAEHYVVSH